MTCSRALELLLDAEPRELALAVESPLVEHLRTCSKCRGVAAHLRAGTEAMAATAGLGEPLAVVGRRARRRQVWIGAAAAAALVLLALPRPARDGGPAKRPAVTGNAAAPSQDAVPAPVATMSEPTPARRPGLTRRTVPAPASQLRRFPAVPFHAVPVAALRATPPTADAPATALTLAGNDGAPRNAAGSRAISVVPPAGVRATVMMTSNPAVTVVWLHAADTTRSPR